MSFSATVSQTTFNTRKVIDRAFARCRLLPEQISGENLSTARDNLYTILSALANEGAPLWAIEKAVYPLYEGVGYIATYKGTVDLANANVRSTPQATGTVTSNSTTHETAFASPTSVITVGIKWSAASVPFSLQFSNDGSTWDVVQSEENPAATAGEWTWFDTVNVAPRLYFRVVADSGTLSYSSVYLGSSPTEIPLARINRDDYMTLPNKSYMADKPLQYWLDRKALSPVLRLWPTPNATSENYQVVLWAHRHIMDVGTLQQEVEVPQRWLDVVIGLLAARLAMETPDVDPNIIGLLKQDAAALLYSAQTEESDDSPIRWTPDISAYTR